MRRFRELDLRCSRGLDVDVADPGASPALPFAGRFCVTMVGAGFRVAKLVEEFVMVLVVCVGGGVGCGLIV